MKNAGIRRAGVLALAVIGMVLPSKASAYANFARRYGVSCSVCHNSWPQLTPAGYKFRTAGYRMPDEIGNDAKWSNWGDNMSVRTQESYVMTAAVTGTNGTPTNGFVNGGLEMYPWEGSIGKYTATNVEVDFAAGNTAATKGTIGGVSMNSLNLLGTFPINADSFITTRVGLFGALQGYGASDRGVGALSPTFKPTPAQIAPGSTKGYTYPAFGPTGEGIEVAYNWKDTHVAAQILNGYNSYNGSANQGEDNRYKDFAVFINQMIGESAIAAYFYNGTTGYSKTPTTAVNGISGAEASATVYGADWYDNYMRGILYATIKPLKDDKLDLLLGFCDGTDHTYDTTTKNSSHVFHSMGWFATLQNISHVMNHQLTSAVSYGTNRASTDTAGNRVSDVTLSFAVPIENNRFSLDLQSRRAQQLNAPDQTTNKAQFQYSFMF